MLNMGFQTYFLESPVDEYRVVRGPNELKIVLSILTRRGGTDTNSAESTRKAILRDWHVTTLALQTLGISGKMPQINSNKYENMFFEDQD